MDSIRGHRDHQSLKVYINDLLHLEVRMEGYMGFQSWFEGSGRTKKMFFMEFYHVQGEPMLVEYDERGVWESVLRIVDESV